MFLNCSNFPDITAFTDTRISDASCIPYVEEYNFEHRDSPNTIGGVGVFVSDKLNYTIRIEYQLEVSGCENIWLEIDLKNNRINKRHIAIVPSRSNLPSPRK